MRRTTFDDLPPRRRPTVEDTAAAGDSSGLRQARADLRSVRIVLALLAAATLVVTLIHAWPGAGLTVPFEGPDEPARLALPPGVSGQTTGQLTLTIGSPSMVERLVGLAPMLTGAVLILVGVWLLWRVLDVVAGSDPFAPGTTRRVTTLGVFAALAGAVWPFVAMLCEAWMSAHLGLESITLAHLDLLDFWPVLAGSCILVLNQAFVRGVALRRDVEGLV